MAKTYKDNETGAPDAQRDSIVLSGVVHDRNAISDSGELVININDFHSLKFPVKLRNQHFEGQYLNNEYFDHTVAAGKNTSYMEIRYSSPDRKNTLGKYRPFYTGSKYFLIERGDSLEMKVTPESIQFSGRGATKMNIQADIIKIEVELSKSLIDNQNGDYKEYFLDKVARTKEICQKKLSYLEQNKNRLELDIYNRLYYDIIGKRNYRILSELSASINSGWPTDKLEKAKFDGTAYKVLAIQLEEFEKDHSDDWHVSPYYMDFLLLKEMMEMKMEGSKESGRQKATANPEGLYRNILHGYSGKMRQRLLLMAGVYFLNHGGTETGHYFKTIRPMINAEPYREILTGLMQSRMAKRSAYPFALPDSSGKTVRLSDFKGKILVMDFWFTGCLPCRKLKKFMEPIVSTYKGKDVVFVTVSIDKDGDYWKKYGLKSGAYTHAGSIDLFTNGLGWNHPIMKFYNFNGVPSLLIIDEEGYIINSNPPMPDGDRGTQYFMNIINAAL